MYNSFLPPPPFIRKRRVGCKNSYNATSNYTPDSAINSISMKESHSYENDNSSKSTLFQHQYNEAKASESEVLFEIFGLKIYFDDLLLLCILFFLYQEGIQDEYLFIALMLLLLS